MEDNNEMILQQVKELFAKLTPIQRFEVMVIIVGVVAKVIVQVIVCVMINITLKILSNSLASSK